MAMCRTGCFNETDKSSKCCQKKEQEAYGKGDANKQAVTTKEGVSWLKTVSSYFARGG